MKAGGNRRPGLPERTDHMPRAEQTSAERLLSGEGVNGWGDVVEWVPRDSPRCARFLRAERFVVLCGPPAGEGRTRRCGAGLGGEWKPRKDRASRFRQRISTLRTRLRSKASKLAAPVWTDRVICRETGEFTWSLSKTAMCPGPRCHEREATPRIGDGGRSDGLRGLVCARHCGVPV
jgi:hypothetical protein